MKSWLPCLPGLVVLLLGASVALIPVALFPICEADYLSWVTDFQPTMRCFWFGQAEILLGICVAVAGLALLLRPTRDCSFAVGWILIALGIAIFLVSLNGVIGSVCGHVNSRCQIGTKPAVRLAGGLTGFVGFVLLLWSLRKPRFL
ncbi:DUF4418 family protein [Planctomycetota bacterium]